MIEKVRIAKKGWTKLVLKVWDEDKVGGFVLYILCWIAYQKWLELEVLQRFYEVTNSTNISVVYHTNYISSECVLVSWDHVFSWWRHQMESFSALQALFERNPPVTGGLPSLRTVTRNFDDFFDLGLNKRLSKQTRRRWFETPSHPWWHHCNAYHNSLVTWKRFLH